VPAPGRLLARKQHNKTSNNPLGGTTSARVQKWLHVPTILWRDMTRDYFAPAVFAELLP
jgi:hypothetical protein